jgi:hypothetical protein
METRTHDRRRHPRHLPTRDVTGKVKSTMDFRMIDISEGGLLVETLLGLPPATVCELKVDSFGSELQLKAEVRRCRAQLKKTDAGCKVVYRSGLEFVDLDDKSAAAVRQLIANCCDANTGNTGATVTEGAVVGGSLYTV